MLLKEVGNATLEELIRRSIYRSKTPVTIVSQNQPIEIKKSKSKQEKTKRRRAVYGLGQQKSIGAALKTRQSNNISKIVVQRLHAGGIKILRYCEVL